MSESPEQPQIRPMSRSASRVFVIVCLLLMIGAAVGGAWYLVRVAKSPENRNRPEIAPRDTSAPRGFGVTDG